jgi:periplasmic protein TonB
VLAVNQFVLEEAQWKRLGWALAASLLLHALLVIVLTSLPAGEKQLPRPERVDVRLRELPPIEPAPAPAPKLVLPEEKRAPSSTPNASAPSKENQRRAPAGSTTRDGVPQNLAGDAARSAHKQMAKALLYPREAIEQGLEGQATVLLFLDSTGNVLAARLEDSSGHALLDEAAVRAARSLRGLPDAAPREALLPVRFRLR